MPFITKTEMDKREADKIAAQPKPVVVTAPKPILKEERPQISSEVLVNALVQAIRSVHIEIPTPQVTVQSSAIKPIITPANSPKKWEFSIKRDREGLIQSIIAEAG